MSAHGEQPQDTTFEALVRDAPPPEGSEHRRALDGAIALLGPVLIFVMCASVLWFLLDVRSVYTTVNDLNLRWAGTWFLVGIVAINRMHAHQGKHEAVLYVVLLALVSTLYTLAVTEMSGMGAAVPGLIRHPGGAALFNTALMLALWLAVNRLTWECCVASNPRAAEIGIFSDVARRWLAEKGEGAKAGAEARAEATLEPYDPTEWTPERRRRREKAPASEAEAEAPKGHPGTGVLLLSIPAMLIFTLGLRVIQHGGPGLMARGNVLLVAYTAAALLLLMFTSLGGVLEYFRERRVPIPPALPAFWLTFGGFLTLVVLVGAVALPKPALPPPADIAQPGAGDYRYPIGFELRPVERAPEEAAEHEAMMRVLTWGVLGGLAAFAAYTALRGVGLGAARVAARRATPAWMRRWAARLDALLQTLLRPPRPRKRRRRLRIQRDIAASAQYRNPMGAPGGAARMTPGQHIAYAYEALCALAEDLAAPKRPGQTPYEFLRAFPPELDSIRPEAAELTELFVEINYGGRKPPPRVEDRLRRFWTVYERARNRVLK